MLAPNGREGIFVGTLVYRESWQGPRYLRAEKSPRHGIRRSAILCIDVALVYTLRHAMDGRSFAETGSNGVGFWAG